MTIGTTLNRHCGLNSICFLVWRHTIANGTTCYNVGIRRGLEMMAQYDTMSKLIEDDVTGQIDVYDYPCMSRIVVEVLGFVPIDLSHF